MIAIMMVYQDELNISDVSLLFSISLFLQIKVEAIAIGTRIIIFLLFSSFWFGVIATTNTYKIISPPTKTIMMMNEYQGVPDSCTFSEASINVDAMIVTSIIIG